MIHKVGTNGASGSIKKAIDYVLGEKDHNHEIRDRVLLLEGDPDLLLSLEKTMTTKNTYIHTSLSFTEEETKMINDNPSLLDDILSSYKEQLAAGLPDTDANRLASMAVRHDESDGKMHIHIITLRQDLETGKSYQPFVSQRGDIKRFQDWNVTMQNNFNLENPNSIEHQQSVSQTKNLPKKVQGIRDLADGLVRDAIEAGEVTNRKEVIQLLNSIKDIKVSKQTGSFISIEAKGQKRAIRLKGAFYGSNFSNIKNIETEISKRASVNYETSERRLSESMQKLAKSSHYKYEKNNMDVGHDTDTNISSDINIDTKLDMVSVSRNDRPIQDRLGREHMGQSNEHGSRREQSNLGTTERERINPKHKIFNGVQYDKQSDSWAWKGSYGYVHVQATDNGYSLAHGSKMEWTMAAQLLKENGAKEASITCSSEQSLTRALTAHKEAGLLITSIKLNGQSLSKEDLKERLQDYDKKTEFTRDSIAIGRAGEERQTGSSINDISERATEFNRAFTEYADDIEQAGHAVNNLIATIEDDLEAARQEEEELELVNSTGKGRK